MDNRKKSTTKIGHVECSKQNLPETDLENPSSSVSPKACTRYSCPNCGNHFNCDKGLDTHRRIVHGIGKWKHTCNKCNVRFWKKPDLDTHIQEYHVQKKEKKRLSWCNLCKRNFWGKQGIKNHNNRVHGTMKKRLEKHGVSSANMPNTIDQQDSRELKNYLYIERKAKIKAQENILIAQEFTKCKNTQDKTNEGNRCNKCQKDFGSWLALYTHKKFKHKGRPVKFCRKHHRRFTSKHCPENVSTHKSINKPSKKEVQHEHKRRAFPFDARKIKCQLCGFQYKSDNIPLAITAMQVHIKEKHSRSRGNARRRPSLQHRNTTASEQEGNVDKAKRCLDSGAVDPRTEEESKSVPIDCPYCCGKFKTEENLRLHIRALHEKNISVQCRLCSKTFIGQTALKAHLNVAHGEDVSDDPDYVPSPRMA